MIVARGQTLVTSVGMVVEQCCNCGMLFAMTQDFKDEKLKYRANHNRKTFYCPNGHPQFYTGETEEQKLKRELAQVEKDKEWYAGRYKSLTAEVKHERARANGYKGHATRITKRVKAGVCICCNRTFVDLARHMASKHPELTPQTSVEEPVA